MILLDKIVKILKKYLNKEYNISANQFYEIVSLMNQIKKENEQIKLIVAGLQKSQNDTRKKRLGDFEYKVFSQWGEDGIIQFIISRIEIKNKIFIEIGVEDYIESNTRYLLINDNWRGLIIDGNYEKINKVKSQEIMWKYDITVINEFIKKSNINQIISDNGFGGNIGLLSIDIDGNEYWIWDSINVINPDIVVCEYQAMWGFDMPVTIPYQEDFVRSKKEYHNIYYSSSLPALVYLAKLKGYSYIGSNKVGSNAFFVKNSFLNLFSDLDISICYNQPGVREFTDLNGNLTYELGSKKLHCISDLPLYNVETNELISISKIYNIDQ